MKKIILMVAIALILTGCTKITDNMDAIVNETIGQSEVRVNTVSTNYELYLPIGVRQVTDSQYNQKFKIRDQYIYLYIDVVSYFYKNTLNYSSSDTYDYYYKQLDSNGKTGYVGISKVEDDKYFTEIVYNYSKIEFYSDLEDLPVVLANSLIIQNSIKFNDNMIALELGNTSSDGREVKYELDKPKDSESTFSQYLQEYVTEEEPEVVLPDGN